MNINERIVRNILLKLEEMNNDKKFKKMNPGITAKEYLYAKLYYDIKTERIINILNFKAKRITLKELVCISKALNVSLYELVK